MKADDFGYPGVGALYKLSGIRAALDREDWEEDPDNPGTEIRRVYLGSVFTETPSGKFYTPFACGNVRACESCRGRGTMLVHPRKRVAKRIATRAARIRRSFERRSAVNELSARAWLAHHSQWKRAYGPSCTACGGLGSREAHLDERWREYAERAIESIGAPTGIVGIAPTSTYLEWSDGDCFACECRDAPEQEDQDPDGATQEATP